MYLLGWCNDGFNTVIPYEQSAYNQYNNARSEIAIERDSLLSLKGNQFALHPSMPGLNSLFNNDDVAIMGNVGALLEPTTRTSYRNESVRVPANLFSHNHQQEFWQTTTKTTGSTPLGWGGRMMDLLSSANADPTSASSFNLAGNNSWQRGISLLDIALNPNAGIEEIAAFTDQSQKKHIPGRIKAWYEILQQNSDSLFQQQFNNSYIYAEERLGPLFDVYSQSTDMEIHFTNDDLFSRTLATVARMISIREMLGLKRQTFFVQLGGWDSHTNQEIQQAENLATIDAGLTGFHQAMNSLKINDSVTTFTASDFGRSLSINGKGTDHGWTNHHFIMGGAVKGGQVYGDMPELVVDGPDDTRDTGRLIPKYSVDQYGATLGKWME